MINALRNKAPPLTIERLSGHYEDIAECSDDESDEDEKTTKKADVQKEPINPVEPVVQISNFGEAPFSPNKASPLRYTDTAGKNLLFWISQ